MLIAVVTASVVSFAALVTRFKLGFGFSLVLVPVMTHFVGFDRAFHMSIVLEVVAGVLLVREHRETVRWLDAAWLKICGLIGILVGAYVRTLVSLQVVVVSAMSVVALTCLVQIVRPPRLIRRSKLLLAAAGVTSGALNVWTSLSGPPVVLYYLATEDTDDKVRGSLSGYFVLLYVATLGTLLATGSYEGYDGLPELVAGIVTIALFWRLARSVARGLPGELTQVSLLVLLATALATGIDHLTQ